jgi:hypothetical protein
MHRKAHLLLVDGLTTAPSTRQPALVQQAVGILRVPAHGAIKDSNSILHEVQGATAAAAAAQLRIEALAASTCLFRRKALAVYRLDRLLRIS